MPRGTPEQRDELLDTLVKWAQANDPPVFIFLKELQDIRRKERLKRLELNGVEQ